MATPTTPEAISSAWEELRRAYDWKRLSKPHFYRDRWVTWQRYSFEPELEYHDDEEHAHWVLKEEFDRE